MFKSIRIKGIKNIESEEIELGKVNIFIGGNEQGKTAIIEAFQFSIHKHEGDEIITNGEKAAAVTLETINGSKIRRIRKRGGGGTIEVKPNSGSLPDGMTNKAFAEDLLPEFHFKPTALCHMSASQQREEILSALERQINLTDAQKKIVGISDPNLTAIQLIDKAEKTWSEKRRESGAIVKRLQAVVDTEESGGEEIDLDQAKKDQKKILKKISEAESFVNANQERKRLEDEIKKEEEFLSSIEGDLGEIETLREKLSDLEEKEKKEAAKAKKAKEKYDALVEEENEVQEKLDQIKSKITAMENFTSAVKDGLPTCPVAAEFGEEIECPVDFKKHSEDLKEALKDLKSERAEIKKTLTDISKKVDTQEKKKDYAPDKELHIVKGKLEAMEGSAKKLATTKSAIEKKKKELDGFSIPDVEAVTPDQLGELREKARELAYSIRKAGDKRSEPSAVIKQLKEEKDRWEGLDKRIKDIRSLKDEIFSQLKVPEGFEITEDAVKFKGINLNMLSDKGKYVAAIRLVKAIHPKSKFIAIDGFEKFARNIRAIVLPKMMKDGWQYVVTLVVPPQEDGESDDQYANRVIGYQCKEEECMVFMVKNGKIKRWR
ncbi:MAG: hypothetical protein SVK08_02110 [Halobacteriota archaeon]|nr:hypothetical protein [Halobacteriota archaeon]